MIGDQDPRFEETTDGPGQSGDANADRSRNGDAASIAELGNANSYPNRQY